MKTEYYPEVLETCSKRQAFEKKGVLKDIYKKILFLTSHNKACAQCWTENGQSDAMWRIYGYGERTVRIKISRNSIDYLNDVNAVNVKYVDDLNM